MLIAMNTQDTTMAKNAMRLLVELDIKSANTVSSAMGITTMPIFAV